jgi:hypothetical protein
MAIGPGYLGVQLDIKWEFMARKELNHHPIFLEVEAILFLGLITIETSGYLVVMDTHQKQALVIHLLICNISTYKLIT